MLDWRERRDAGLEEKEGSWTGGKGGVTVEREKSVAARDRKEG